MRIVSIINAWSDTLELLPYAINNHLEFCDGVIVVWSKTSNHGVSDNRMLQFIISRPFKNVLFHQLEPVKRMKPKQNEMRKRNAGLDIARRDGYTHFFIADADELYIPEQVEKDKRLFDDSKINGVVCQTTVYVGKPTLSCYDHTLIPFIHKLKKDTAAGKFRRYPFAYDKNRTSRIDSTRRLNETTGIIMSETVCQHYSYVRADISLKINNSSAKLKNHVALIKRDIERAAPGYVSELYHRPLQEVENYFEIAI